MTPSSARKPRSDDRPDRVPPRVSLFAFLVQAIAATISGFVFTLTTGPRAATFAIGGVVEKPWAHEGTLALRKIQSLSIMIDHDLVDGGPAARFGRRLVDRIERAEGLAV